MSSSVKIPSNYTINMGGGLSITVPTANINAKVVGDKQQPIPMHMTGDTAQPITTQMQGDPNKPIATLLQGDPSKPITTQLQGDPEKPIATTMELMNIPRLSFEDIKDLMTPKLRLQMPNYEQLCFKLFGVEVWSLCLSGEIQAITQPYVPNSYERCEDDCPDVDMRPFPERTAVHKSST
jgi:hypothetical protein